MQQAAAVAPLLLGGVGRAVDTRVNGAEVRIGRAQAGHAKAGSDPQRRVLEAEAGGGHCRADALGSGLRSIGRHAGQ